MLPLTPGPVNGWGEVRQRTAADGVVDWQAADALKQW